MSLPQQSEESKQPWPRATQVGVPMRHSPPLQVSKPQQPEFGPPGQRSPSPPQLRAQHRPLRHSASPQQLNEVVHEPKRAVQEPPTWQ